ncbi:MAG: VTT domain-containing protein [Candidatus Sericytochromatia bacterium]|nr:VTT domain-containing protein [Candidatus Sericytochromatia bacterium]
MSTQSLKPLPREIEAFDPTEPSFWQRLQHPLRLLLAATGILLAVLAFQHYELAQYIDTEVLTRLIEPLGPWSPLAFIGVFVLAALLLVVPYGLLCGLAAILFGPLWGTLWSLLGGTLAAFAVLGLARLLGRDLLARRQGQPKWERINARLAAEGFYYLLLMRLLAVVPFNLLNFACAFTAIRLRDFGLATFIGLIPVTFACNYGATLLLDTRTPLTVLVGIALGLMVLLLSPLVLRQARRRRQQQRRAQIHTAFADFDPTQRRLPPRPRAAGPVGPAGAPRPGSAPLQGGRPPAGPAASLPGQPRLAGRGSPAGPLHASAPGPRPLQRQSGPPRPPRPPQPPPGGRPPGRSPGRPAGPTPNQPTES